MLRKSDDYCFRRATGATELGQLSQRKKCCNCFESNGKISYHLKGTKVFVCGFSGRNLRVFKICREEPVPGNLCLGTCEPETWSPFIVKLQHVMSYKILFGQLYQKRDAYTETLTQLLSVNFGKNMNTTINTSARLPLK